MQMDDGTDERVYAVVAMAGMDEARLGDIIGRLYEAALDAERLPETGACLREALGIGSSIMFVCDRDTGEMRHLVGASENFDAAALADYRAHYHAQNPWFNRARTGSIPVTRRGEELIRDAEFRRTEFASDWCTRVDIRFMMGSIQAISPTIVVGTGVHRSPRDETFSERDMRLYAWLSDHLGRALQVAVRFSVLDGQRLAALESLHGMGVGVALLDAESRVVFLNGVAERLARAGRWLTFAAGRLQPARRSLRGVFAAAVAAAAATSGGTGLSAGRLLRLVDPLGGALPVTIAPFRAPMLAFGPERPAAVVQFGDPDHPHGPHAAALMAAYGLSPGEARLVEALVGGASLQGYARAAGLSRNSVRTQLARAFAKTGVTRQQDLVIKAIHELATAVPAGNGT